MIIHKYISVLHWKLLTYQTYPLRLHTCCYVISSKSSVAYGMVGIVHPRKFTLITYLFMQSKQVHLRDAIVIKDPPYLAYYSWLALPCLPRTGEFPGGFHH